MIKNLGRYLMFGTPFAFVLILCYNLEMLKEETKGLRKENAFLVSERNKVVIENDNLRNEVASRILERIEVLSESQNGQRNEIKWAQGKDRASMLDNIMRTKK